MLDDLRRAVLDRVAQFAAAIVSMHRDAQPVACVEVFVRRGANLVTGDRLLDRRSNHHRQWLADLEAEFRVQAERGVGISRLHKPDPGQVVGRDAIEHVLHHRAAGAAVLHFRIDADWTDPRNRRALVHEIAAGDASVQLGDDPVEAGSRNHTANDTDASLRRRELVRKIMLIGDGAERAITNIAEHLDILAGRAPNLCIRLRHDYAEAFVSRSISAWRRSASGRVCAITSTSSSWRRPLVATIFAPSRSSAEPSILVTRPRASSTINEPAATSHARSPNSQKPSVRPAAT